MNTGLKKIIDNSSYGCGMLLGELNHVGRSSEHPMLDMMAKKSYNYNNYMSTLGSSNNDLFWNSFCYNNDSDGVYYRRNNYEPVKEIYWYRPESYWKWKKRNSTRNKMKGIEVNRDNVEYEMMIGAMNRVIDYYKLSLERKLMVEEEMRKEEERKEKERLENLRKYGYSQTSGTQTVVSRNNNSVSAAVHSIYAHDIDSFGGAFKDFTNHVEAMKNKRIFDNLIKLIKEEMESI